MNKDKYDYGEMLEEEESMDDFLADGMREYRDIEREYNDDYMQYACDDDGYEGGRDDYNGYSGFDGEDW